MRVRIGIAVLALLLGYGAFVWAGAVGRLGRPEGPGAIEGERLPPAVIQERATAQRAAAHSVGASAAKSILFGDLHVHTSVSLDGMLMSLPVAGGEGTRPQADACDFARYCSALDFWSITDHAEMLTPRIWQDTLASVRECQARAGESGDPDLVSFLGWEWTQIGYSAADHYGHRNVILRELEDDGIPARPIAARPTRASDLLGDIELPTRLAMVGARPRDARMRDFARYLREQEEAERCDKDVPTRELPRDCMETAPDPGVLQAKLREWGHPALVIPHGTAWGIYTPADSGWEKQITNALHDPTLQGLVEIYSGHGNSEEYRAWRPVLRTEAGEITCPAPTPDYVPLCWRAGEIILEHCLSRGGAPNECATRAEQARRHFLAAPELANELTVPGASEQEWLDAGQCRDCFLPAWYHRPLGAVQYMLALTNFEDAARPWRFRFGFIGSSDVHTGRPGTGYKEHARRQMTDFQRDGIERPAPAPAAELPPARSVPHEEVRMPSFGDQGGDRDDQRLSAYFFTGGLVAVHAESRRREAIWDALERREVYATSGPRILLWFDLLNAPSGEAPMGAAQALGEIPRFRVRAVGSFVQQAGCPDFVNAGGIGPARLEALCRGECYHPTDERRRITRIEVVRIRPQASPGEPVDELIEDPWHTFGCQDVGAGCQIEFDDPEFLGAERDAVYYVRAIEEPSPAVNAKGLGCERDEAGLCTRVDTKPTSAEDDRLAEIEERAWSSPIFVDFAPGTGAPPLDAEGRDPLEPGFAD